MAKYKVKALYLGGLGNKVFKSGDEVDDKQFPEGNAQKLVEKGFLVEINPKATKESKPKEEAPNEEESQENKASEAIKPAPKKAPRKRSVKGAAGTK